MPVESREKTTNTTIFDPEEAEQMVCDYARTRDGRTRETLFLHHQRLVKSIAARFLGYGESLEDLVQVGNIGLTNALDRYDPGQDTRFSTYATPTILGEIKRHLRDKTMGIEVAPWLQKLHKDARRASQQLTQELGRGPSVSEVAQRLGASEEETLQALESAEIAAGLASLESSPTVTDSVDSAERVGQAESVLHDLESYGGLRAAFARLDEREREILRLRFFEERSHEEIAKRLGLSARTVRSSQSHALKQLKILLALDLPKAYHNETDAVPPVKAASLIASAALLAPVSVFLSQFSKGQLTAAVRRDASPAASKPPAAAALAQRPSTPPAWLTDLKPTALQNGMGELFGHWPSDSEEGLAEELASLRNTKRKTPAPPEAETRKPSG